MFTNKEYLQATIAMFSYEKTLLGYTRVMADNMYQQKCYSLMFADKDDHNNKKIRMLASWALPITLASISHPDDALRQAEQALSDLTEGKKLSKQFDGMLAMAIQSLRLHNEFSFQDFIT